MRIFLSYASEHSEFAKEIALALRAESHTVFFDRSALAPGEAYKAQIRKPIEDNHLFVFVISPHSAPEGRYTLTELEFAEHEWHKPWGRVLSVPGRCFSHREVSQQGLQPGPPDAWTRIGETHIGDA